MCYACKTSCARNIIGVIPYLPYSKQSKMKKRGCIVSKLVAQMLTKSGKNLSALMILLYFYKIKDLFRYDAFNYHGSSPKGGMSFFKLFNQLTLCFKIFF